MEMVVKIAAVLAGAYAVVIAVLAMSQTALLFPRWAVGPVPALPAGAVPLRLDRPDGVTLHGHLLPGSRDRSPIIAFGGNAWNAGDVALLLHRILPGHPVAAFHYRGYAPSGGRPSAQALSEDALAIYDHLDDQLSGDAGRDRPPVVIGLSIGSGPAAHVAARRPVRGLILVTPFDSLSRLAQEKFPWAPVSLVLRHKMAPAAELTGQEARVAIIAAARDEIVPPARSEALRAALGQTEPGIVFDQTLAAGHNDLYGHPEFSGTLREAMATLTRGEPSTP
ncbi:MAG: alpha/beta hydrolase [Loktanella sp.]|nr:alpha/beta hydrolase [Loktanella sp.]